MEIQVKKINEFKFFDPENFSISPFTRNLFCIEKDNLEDYIYDDIIEKAKEVDGIGIGFIRMDDGFGSYVLGVPSGDKPFRRFLLLNAVECDKDDEEDKVRVVFYTDGEGHLKEMFVKYQKGDIL